MKLVEINIDAITGEKTITEREETTAEIKAREKYEADLLIENAKEEARATAKADLLKRLGITAEEARLLLS